jgi:hypothetical protein
MRGTARAVGVRGRHGLIPSNQRERRVARLAWCEALRVAWHHDVRWRTLGIGPVGVDTSTLEVDA